MEDEPETLVMRAQKGLPEAVQNGCARVTFGQCLCGLAASRRKPQSGDHQWSCFETYPEETDPRGHYCVPMLSPGGMLGALSVWVKWGGPAFEKRGGVPRGGCPRAGGRPDAAASRGGAAGE